LKPKKLKKCKICEKQFAPSLSTQKVCSPSCAIVFAGTQRQAREAKARNKLLREGREALKTNSQLKKEAQAQFNRYIRLRDEKENTPCPTCGTFSPSYKGRGGNWDAGHWLSRGSHPEHIFDEQNVVRQCKKCNTYGFSSARFRQAIIDRFGQDAVDRLEGPNELPRYRAEDFRRIKKEYAEKCKEISRLTTT